MYGVKAYDAEWHAALQAYPYGKRLSPKPEGLGFPGLIQNAVRHFDPAVSKQPKHFYYLDS